MSRNTGVILNVLCPVNAQAIMDFMHYSLTVLLFSYCREAECTAHSADAVSCIAIRGHCMNHVGFILHAPTAIGNVFMKYSVFFFFGCFAC